MSLDRHNLKTTYDLIQNENFRSWVYRPDLKNSFDWNQWMDDNPEMVEQVNEAKQVLLHLNPKVDTISSTEKEDIWALVNQEINRKSDGEIDSSSHDLNKRSYIRRTYYVAAAVAMIMCFAVVFQISHLENDNDRLDKSYAEYVTKQNPIGRRSNIVLPDGSEVVLNAQSSIRYRKGFVGNKREVVLSGEAFFKVAKDSLKPFEVYTANTVTRALGTSFNVKAFEDDTDVHIALIEGKVSVINSQKSIKTTLSPGEGIIYDKELESAKKSKFDSQKVLSWKDGIVYLENIQFNEAIKTLERWYAVEIEVINLPKSSLTCFGTFENQPLERVLKSLAYSLDFEYEIEEKQIKVIFH